MTLSLVASAVLLALFVLGVGALAGDRLDAGSPSGVLTALFDRAADPRSTGAAVSSDYDGWSLAGRRARLTAADAADAADAGPVVEAALRPIDLRLQRVEARVRLRHGGGLERGAT